MKFDRTRNASRNIVAGLVQRLYQTIVPFLMRTAMIYWLGVEYLGLDGLFTSVLSVLNLAELGIGSAMVYSMYKPVAEDDKDKICALMHLYKIYYRAIGCIVLVSGLIIYPFIPRLIHGTIPNGLNVYILYLLNLGATVLSYWLFAYKNSLLQAYQRKDIDSSIAIAGHTVRYALQFILLFVFHNYYVYLIITLLSQALINVSTALVIDKMYPGYKAHGILPQAERITINQRIRDLFTAKLGGVVVNSVDTIVISAFLGLSVLAIYQNYYFIITALLSVVNIVLYSCTAGIGNSIITETKEKNYYDLRTLTLIISFLATFCTACLLCIYQPFMDIWVGEELKFDYPAVVCLGVYFFIVEINTLLNTYKDASGIWHEDRFRPIITAIVNLSLNLITVQFMGVYGVLLSTVVSMVLVGMPWLIHNLFSTVFDKNWLKLYLRFLAQIVVFCLETAVCSVLVCSGIGLSGIWAIIVNASVCGVFTLVFFLLMFIKTDEFTKAIKIIDRITGKRLNFLSAWNKRRVER